MYGSRSIPTRVPGSTQSASRVFGLTDEDDEDDHISISESPAEPVPQPSKWVALTPEYSEEQVETAARFDSLANILFNDEESAAPIHESHDFSTSFALSPPPRYAPSPAPRFAPSPARFVAAPASAISLPATPAFTLPASSVPPTPAVVAPVRGARPCMLFPS